MYFFLIKLTDALIFPNLFLSRNYMFRAVSLSIIRSFPLYMQHWYMSCSFDDSSQARLVVLESGKLLMMGRGTARSMWRFLTKINLEISATVGFIKKKFVTMHGHTNLKYA
jgi:hypothetical protein